MRILVAVHGYEPPNWARELPGVLPLSPGAVVSVLGVIDAPAPAFTSLTPCARRAYRAALAAWREEEETRIRASLDTLVQPLPRGVETVWAQAARQGPARAIVEHATAQLADLLAVGRDTRPRLERLVLGSIHRMVVREAPCGVLAWPRSEVEATGLRLTKLDSLHGFAAETAAASAIDVASRLGIPLSTTQTITTAIMGLGSTRRLSAVRWGVGREIVTAWVLTFPACGLIAWGVAKLLPLLR